MTPRQKKRKLCGAKTRGGTPCKRGAGAGTSHPGFGKCSTHCGETKSGKAAAAKEEAVELAALLMEHAPPTDPHEAILLCLRSAAGEWRFYEMQIAGLRLEDVIVRPSAEGSVGSGEHAYVSDMLKSEELNLWVKLRNDARDKAARYAEMAARMGVAERQIRLIEELGATIAKLLDGVLGDLQLSPAQVKRKPAVIAKHLALLEGGSV